MRTLWMAAELDLAFEHRPVEWKDPALKPPGFTALYPAGTIPTIVDDGFALAESMAINLYLAKKHSRGETGLYPASPEAEAEVWRWSLWAQGQLEPWAPRDARTAPLREAAGAQLSALIAASLDVLDRAWRAAERYREGSKQNAA